MEGIRVSVPRRGAGWEETAVSATRHFNERLPTDRPQTTMRSIVSAELVNGRFGDPALYLDFRSRKRAILFDIGDLSALPPKRLLRITDAFVSHTHMDHFEGFDRLLR